jgi:hypothetical protein
MTIPAPATMTAEHWRLVDQMLHGALICTREHREAFVANSCGGNAALRAEVSSLLEAYDALPAGFLERSAMEEQGMTAAPVARAAEPAQPRRLVPAALAIYSAAAGILFGAVAGWSLAHSPTVDRWRGTVQAIRQSSANTAVAPAGAPEASTSGSSGRISPHRHWIAFSSSESGRDEVYVDSYPRPGYRVMISQGGGTAPEWRSDGRELYYWRGDVLVAVPIDGSRIDRPPVLGAERVLLTRGSSGSRGSRGQVR